MPVDVHGRRARPATGPATIVANRGFGVVEPAALGVAVQRATGRRLRVVGAPAVPFLGAATRRLGAIGASEHDVAVALRAGHLVGVPLSPTWLRTGAGLAPHALMPALTHAPIIPAAVTTGGPFGTPLGAVAGAVRPAGHARRGRTTPTTRSRRRASPTRCAPRSRALLEAP